MNLLDEYVTRSDQAKPALTTTERLVLLIVLASLDDRVHHGWTVLLADLAALAGMDRERAYGACYGLQRKGRLGMQRYEDPKRRPVLMLSLPEVG